MRRARMILSRTSLSRCWPASRHPTSCSRSTTTARSPRSRRHRRGRAHAAATRRLLAQVAQRYPCVVISGRRARRPRRGGCDAFRSGTWSAITASRRVGTTRRSLGARARLGGTAASRACPAQRGLVIEPKRHSVTVHYRHVRDKPRVLELLAEAGTSASRRAGDLTAPRRSTCFRSNGAHKGLALQQACRAFACDTAIYIGDDDTDEDAFASAGPERLLSIRVGTRGPSVARYRLKRQAEIDALMKTLIALRRTRA